MSKQLKDYLHLYLGCEAICEKSNYYMVHNWLIHNGDKMTIQGRVIDYLISHTVSCIIKPILRPLSDMTEEEMFTAIKIGKLMYHGGGPKEWVKGWTAFSAENFQYLLSKHFDLFGLIEAGLAIDKTKHTIEK